MSNFTGISEDEWTLHTGLRFKSKGLTPDGNGVYLEMVPRFRPTPQGTAQIVQRPLLGDTVYHATPHDWDRFDMSKIGTGEGNKDYGYGAYVAQEPLVSHKYYKQFADAKIRDFINENFERAGSTWTLTDRAKAINDVMKMSPQERSNAEQQLRNAFYNRSTGLSSDESARLRALDAYESRVYNKPAQVFKIGAHDHPDYLLNGDKPINQQTPQVLEALKHLGVDTTSGGSIKSIVPQTHAEMKEFLKSGIQGVKYLDQKSRAIGHGTSNYVLYDEGSMDLLKKGHTHHGFWEEH
jgi:hypothetical protein